tara:strand:- start:390 stop:794 length:405 start_codon:yes stop_codon:yes gene_type:complete
MNKQELKKILKPLIKECIKEVIFEDGVLSSVISEVMVASSAQIKKPARQVVENLNADKNKLEQKNQKLQEQRKQMLDVIGKEAYNGVNIFEGITPTPSPAVQGQGPLAGTAPNDPGVDIGNFASTTVWKKLAGN